MRERRVLTAVVALLVLLVVAMAGLLTWQAPLLRTGTGYAAHNACALGFLTDRTDDPANDLPPNPLVPVLRTSTDDSTAVTTASVLSVGFRQRAWYSPAGCAVGGRVMDTGSLPYHSAAAASSPLPDGRGPLSATARDGVDRAVDAAFGAPGTRSVVVLRGGELVAERYADGFTDRTRQLGWSMGKSITAVLAGRIVHDRLGDGLGPATDHLLPEWTDARSQITLDQLLRMSSGLTWDEEYALGTTITEMLYDSPDMGAFAASQPLAHAPGSTRQYSSGSTVMACRAMHERTGMGPDMAHRLVFEPLGMNSAVMEADASGHLVCGSYAWATPRDWARFGQFALDDGVVGGTRLLPEGWMSDARHVTPAAGEPEPYGAGWWVNRADEKSPLRFPTLPADAYWAAGHDGQYVVVVPSQRLVVVRMGFSPGGDLPGLGVDRMVADVGAALR